MNIIRRLSVYHEDLSVNNIHAIVLVLLPEVISKYLNIIITIIIILIIM